MAADNSSFPPASLAATVSPVATCGLGSGRVLSSSPVLVSGVYRSGTTFLAAFLGAHPQLEAASSTVKFLRFCQGRYGDLNVGDNLDRLLDDTRQRLVTRWSLAFDVGTAKAELAEAGSVTYATAYDVTMRVLLLKEAPADVRWVEKLAMQWTDIPLFLEMFPNGHVIHILRDPRDVTASYKAMTFETGFAYLDAAFNCRHAMDCAMRYRAELPAQRFMAVRAEDIAVDPGRWARTLCDFLGLPHAPEMLDGSRLSARGEDWRTNTSFDGSFAGLPKPKPRWPDRLSRAETIFIELITQPQLATWGYEASRFEPSKDVWQEIASFVEDTFIASRFRAWLATGQGAQGYKTDPYEYEMRMVFPERFNSVAGGMA